MRATIDRAAVIAAYVGGESVASIMQRTGHSQTGIYTVLGDTPRHVPQRAHYACWTARQQGEMIRLYAAGLSLREIGDRLGKSWTAIAAKRKALGLKRPDKIQRLHASRAHANVWTEAQDRSLTQLFYARYLYADIGRLIGRTRMAVQQRVVKLGLKRSRAGAKASFARAA